MSGGAGRSGADGNGIEHRNETKKRKANNMSEKLSDTQKRALLQAEVQKLKGAGMEQSRAFQVAFEGHPEWRATGEQGLPVGRAAPRGRAQMLNDLGAGDADRTAEIQRLVAEYQRTHPGTSYDAAFTKVLSDPKNKALAESLHKPGHAPVNLWRPTRGDGKTPTNPHGPQGQGSPGSAETPADRAAHCAG
jgi:hypothetical protein